MNSNTKNSADWNFLAAYLSGNTNAEDTVRMEKWIAESDENKAVFLKAQKVWKSSLGVDVSKINVNAAWDKVNSKAAIVPKSKTIQLNTPTKYILRIAAVLVVGLLSWWFVGSLNNSKTLLADKVMQIALNDGSTIDLNSNASLTYPEKFKGNTREVKLTGEAFFNIARNPKKPFIIHTEKADIKVLGTSFNVNTLADGNVEVIVKTGVVKVTAAQSVSEIILHKNEKVMVDAKSGTFTKGSTDNYNYLAWKTHSFEFRETTLREVFENIEKVYGVTITVSNTSIYNCKLTANYENLQAFEMIKMIELTFGFKAGVSGNNIQINGGNCDIR